MTVGAAHALSMMTTAELTREAALVARLYGTREGEHDSDYLRALANILIRAFTAGISQITDVDALAALPVGTLVLVKTNTDSTLIFQHLPGFGVDGRTWHSASARITVSDWGLLKAFRSAEPIFYPGVA